MLEACERYMVHFNWLTRYAEENLKMLYNLSYKLHHFWHIVYHARYLNPKLGWCFQFEDFVGTMIKCARGCMHGTPWTLVGKTCLENFLLLIQIRVRD